jgi:hypothetical protein
MARTAWASSPHVSRRPGRLGKGAVQQDEAGVALAQDFHQARRARAGIGYDPGSDESTDQKSSSPHSVEPQGMRPSPPGAYTW